MGGRYNNRGRRGRSRNRNGNHTGGRGNNNNNNNINRPVQREYKFASLNTGNVSRFHPFETVKQKLVQELQSDKDMVKVAQAIDDMKEIDFDTTKPTRDLSTIQVFVGTGEDRKKDPELVDKREIDQQGLDVEWKLKMDAWCDQKQKYEDGMISASAMVMSKYVTTGLHSKLLNLDIYESKLKRNPINLLTEINKLAHDGATTTYKWKTVLTGLIQTSTISMDMNEPPNDFRKRVSAVCDVLENLLTKYWLRGAIENDEAYKNATNDAERNKLCEAAWNEFKAYLMLHGCLDLKYGSMKQQLLSLASLNDDKYPKTLTKMNEHISNHRWDPEWSEYVKSNKEKKRQQKEKRELAMAQQHNVGDFKCYCCGADDHKSNKCPKRATTDRKDWWIAHAIQNFQQNVSDGNESDQTQTTDNTSDRRSEQVQNTQTQTTTAPPRRSRSAIPAPRSTRGAFQGIQVSDVEGANIELCFVSKDGTKRRELGSLWSIWV